MKTRVVLLGPQRFFPTVAETAQSLGIVGDIATVTAGWQERESEDAELADHLGSRTVNLVLHRRSDEVFQLDRELLAGHRLRQERLRQLQAVYRLQLAHAKEAARELMRSEGDRWLLDPERQAAIEAIQRLDAHHLERMHEVHKTFEESWRPHERPTIARHRRDLAKILGQTSALAIAGGHVAVLLNRLKLFGVLEFARNQPILAWSAGAMVLAERIVVFHDSPPQGPGNAEVLASGFGLFPGVVALPHARKRLKLDDPPRVSLFARRFDPAACVCLDEKTRVDWDGGLVIAAPGTVRLTPWGSLEEMVRA